METRATAAHWDELAELEFDGGTVALRLYGATQPFYDQSWIPDDVVKIG